jgi:hypothetical protein
VAICLAGCSPAAPVDTADSSALEAEIRRNLAENFGSPGDASWYESIQTVIVQGSTLVIVTDLTTRSTDASGVCAGASNYVFANSADPRLRALEVRGPGGQVLIRRESVSDPC